MKRRATLDTQTADSDRPRMDADIVCVGSGPAFGLMLQIATSKVADGETT
jgi:hypothetical protein